MADPAEPMAPARTFVMHWIGLAAAIAVLILFRLHAFDLPLETDECNYAYIGTRLLAGDRLYTDVWDHQPFGVFVLFAATIAAFGDAPVVFRVLALVFSIVSLLLVAMILRRASGLRAALLGAMLFAVASSDPGTGGEGCNREIYMTTLILAAWYFAVNSRLPLSQGAGARRSWVVLSGIALGLASTLKPIVAIHWVFLAAWLVFPLRRDIRALLGTLMRFASGPVVIWAASLSYFAGTDRLAAFVEAVFQFNIGYSETGEPFHQRFIRFFNPIRHRFIFESALPLWLAGAAAFLWLLVQTIRRKTHDSAAVIALAVAGYFATCLSGRFWPHYYYLLIGPAVLAFCVFADSIAKGLFRLRRVTARIVAISALFLVLPLFLAFWETRHYLFQPLHNITVKRYNFRDFWGRAQGENMAAVTEAHDRVFVYGNEAEIYYYSGRRCASRLTMITGLAAGMPSVEHRRQTLIEELTANLPRVILVVFDEKPFPEWLRFLETYYGPAVGVDYHDDHPEDNIMLVFARKNHPIRAIDWNWDRRRITDPS